jgi:malonyl-CoA O-methyltransferase
MTIPRDMFPTNDAAIARDFSRAAQHYHDHARLQYAITDDTARHLAPYLHNQPQPYILDIGCGTGFFAYHAHHHQPHWRILQADKSETMALHAAQRQHKTSICADICAIPLRNASMDAVFSSSCIQWVSSPHIALNECARIVRPNGIICITSFGTHTLAQLQHAFHAHGLHAPILPFLSLEALQAQLPSQWFTVEYAQYSLMLEIHPNAHALMQHLRAIGANYKHAGQSKAMSRTALRAVCASYDEHCMMKHAPEHAKAIPIGEASVTETSVYAVYEVTTIIARRNEHPY